MPPRRSETQNIKRNKTNYNYNRTQQPNNSQQPVNARRVRNIQQSNPDNETIQEENETETETIDPQSRFYIIELTEDWSSINFIQSLNFTTVTNKDLNRNQQGEFWIQTTSNNEEINWFVDTGSARSFISRRTAQHLTKKLGHQIIKTDTNIGEFRRFNNNKTQVEHTIQLDLETGNTTAHNCIILVVPQNTVNLLGRDTLQKLGIELIYTKSGEKIQNIHSIQNNIAKWLFQKYPHV